MPKLKELAQVAQIYGGLNAPQEEQSRQDDRRMQLALQLLNLQQEQEQRAAQAAMQQQELALRQRGLAGQEQQNQNYLLGQANDPNGNPAVLDYIAKQIPGLGASQQAITQKTNQGRANQLAPALKAVYGSNQKSPQNIRPTIDQMGIPPELMGMFDWEGMNQGLAQPEAQPAGALGKLFSGPQYDTGSALPFGMPDGKAISKLLQSLFGAAANPSLAK